LSISHSASGGFNTNRIPPIDIDEAGRLRLVNLRRVLATLALAMALASLVWPAQ
jgi:hypothetical protein